MSHKPAILGYLLGRGGRYGRFGSTLSDQGIIDYSERIDFTRDVGFGIFQSAERFSGFIHLTIHGNAAELGASVLAESRLQGQARQLFGIALH